MSILIHLCGFAACSTILAIGVKSLYENSQVRPSEEDYEVDVPIEERNLPAEWFGLGVEIARTGLYVSEKATDGIFDSRLSKWLLAKTERLKIKPDGEYFEFKVHFEDGFKGWTDEPPKFKPGKYEMEM